MNIKSLLRKVSRILPDSIYLRIMYKMQTGKRLHLNNPQTFNEKLQWLKIHDRNPLYSNMVDKYEAKKYVASIIGDEYIIPTLGVWNRFEDIDFSTLPNQFVLKCTHDSGGLVIVKDKKAFNKAEAKIKIDKSLERNYYYLGREWPYKNVKPRILAEQYMENKEIHEMRDHKKNRGLVDYKFFCFNGKPNLLYVSRGLEHHPTAEISFYGMDGREEHFHRNDYKPYHNAVMPSNFNDMKILAERLAQDVNCPFVRIDLYSINGKIYFSEITFSPCSGMIPFEPNSADAELGKLLKLPTEA